MLSKLIFVLVAGGVIFAGCTGAKKSETTLFELVESSHSGITFENTLEYTDELNVYTFRNFYNGGGVGMGDINNDGLLDIFLAGNLVSNKLYLNKGNLVFEDISASSGVASEGVWTTGVSFVDINADGLLDIYICKSGPPGRTRRNNELFINNGDLTFSEQSREYNLDFVGLSIHAAFLDYDKDGDLDCYLLNNSIRSVGGYDLRKDQRNTPDTLGGNKLLRNDNGKFTDVSSDAGIYTSAIGFGLGVAVGDINHDGWPDMFVSNDFFEKDYLYINQRDGRFKESLEEYIREISLGSMGADMADINNDGYPEIFVTEMLPETESRLKTTGQFESWEKYQMNIQNGYYRQFGRNVLQLNNRDGTFSEISRLAGVHASDWSWGALIFDMDNDGLKDIFVASGIYKDLINQDYINFVADQTTVRNILRVNNKSGIKQLVDSIPSNKIPSYAFHNNGDLTFTNKASNWGLGLASHSNGSAYGDLDNDGDLDLVVNNVNMPASVFKNHATALHPERTYLSFSVYAGENSPAVGTKIFLKSGDKLFYQELSPMRGFMSSVDYKIHFGVGKLDMIDSVLVQWPDGKTTILNNVKTNQQINLYHKDARQEEKSFLNRVKPKSLLTPAEFNGVDFVHEENSFVDFDRDRLRFNMISNEGPCVCTGDVNNDGREDFYIGGAKSQSGRLYIQKKSGEFEALKTPVFESDNESEDTDCIFFDANGDNHIDLYVTSGGYEFSSSSPALRDRLYFFNKGNGRIEKSEQILPANKFESTSTVDVGDIDADGDLDLFIGVRVMPFLYGLPVNGYILINDGNGNFKEDTKTSAPGLANVGMITDAKWLDVNQDKLLDLIVVGEWMPIKLFVNQSGKLVDQTEQYGLSHSNGLYHSIATGDFNGDGFIDFIAGNHGLNSRFRASESEPLTLYINDFDQNEKVEHIITQFQDGRAFPLVLRHDLISQLPGLKKKYLHYRDYSEQTMTDIFTEDQLKNAVVTSATTLETTLWINSGQNSFSKKTLPIETQFAPVYAILVDDYNEDGNADILLGGNLHRAKPETGIYDGSYGLLLKGDGSGSFKSLSSAESGVCIKGEVRALETLKVGAKKMVIVGRNNEYPMGLSFNQ